MPWPTGHTCTGATTTATSLLSEEEEYISPYGLQRRTLVQISILRSGEGEWGKWAVGKETPGGEAYPNGVGDRSSLSTSAAAGGGAAMIAIGGYLLVLSLVLLRGKVRGWDTLASPSTVRTAVWYRRPPPHPAIT